MGDPAYELILAALLHKYPGMSFDALYSRVSAIPMQRSKPQNQIQLARALNLRFTPSYLAFEKVNRDPTTQLPLSDAVDVFCTTSSTCRLVTHCYSIGRSEKFRAEQGDVPKEGMVYLWYGAWGVYRPVLIEKVSSVEESEDDDGVYIRSRFRGRKVHDAAQVELFASVRELAAKYPIYEPTTVFDFTQSDGFLYPSPVLNNQFRWVQREGGYSLDYNAVLGPVQDRASRVVWPFTSIVATAEAISIGYWEALEYQHNGIAASRWREPNPQTARSFLEENEASYCRYERALLDFHSSLHAARSCMTNVEFLRYRLSGSIQGVLEESSL